MQLFRWKHAIQGLNEQQLNWASGYLLRNRQSPLAIEQPQTGDLVTVLCASQTGNARCGRGAGRSERNPGVINTRLLLVNELKPRELVKPAASSLLLVVSTHGEGTAGRRCGGFTDFCTSAGTAVATQVCSIQPWFQL